jgi:4-hydroxybenzoate polyprenyltransferase
MSETYKKPAPDAGQVADAVDKNWVDRFCPAWARPYMRLSRADRPAGTWLLLIPCWWGLFLAILADPNGAAISDVWIFVAMAAGAFLMRGAGCTWNDIADRDIDAQVERTKSRPLPSGQVTTKQAALWMVIQTAMAFGILLTFNSFTIVLGIVALVPVLIYPFAKRFTWWPQVFLGIAFNWGALFGWAAHTGSLSWAPVLLYLAGISWTLFYDTIYALQDKEDDALIGVKSTARLFGDNIHAWLSKFLIVTVTLMTFSVLYAILDQAGPVTLVIALSGIWAFGWHLAWQLRRLDPDKTDLCLVLFRSNRNAGLIPVIFWGFSLILGTVGIAA